MTRPTHFRSFRTQSWLPLPPSAEVPSPLPSSRVGVPCTYLKTNDGDLFVQALRYKNGSVWTANMGWINKGGAS